MIARDGKIIGVYTLIVVLIVALVFTMFKNCSPYDTSKMKQLYAAKDTIIAIQLREIKLLQTSIEDKEVKQSVLAAMDSVLETHQQQNEKLYKLINEKLSINHTKVISASSNNDSLRQLLADF